MKYYTDTRILRTVYIQVLVVVLFLALAVNCVGPTLLLFCIFVLFLFLALSSRGRRKNISAEDTGAMQSE